MVHGKTNRAWNALLPFKTFALFNFCLLRFWLLSFGRRPVLWGSMVSHYTCKVPCANRRKTSSVRFQASVKQKRIFPRYRSRTATKLRPKTARSSNSSRRGQNILFMQIFCFSCCGCGMTLKKTSIEAQPAISPSDPDIPSCFRGLAIVRIHANVKLSHRLVLKVERSWMPRWSDDWQRGVTLQCEHPIYVGLRACGVVISSGYYSWCPWQSVRYVWFRWEEKVLKLNTRTGTPE